MCKNNCLALIWFVFWPTNEHQNEGTFLQMFTLHYSTVLTVLKLPPQVKLKVTVNERFVVNLSNKDQMAE